MLYLVVDTDLVYLTKTTNHEEARSERPAFVIRPAPFLFFDKCTIVHLVRDIVPDSYRCETSNEEENEAVESCFTASWQNVCRFDVHLLAGKHLPRRRHPQAVVGENRAGEEGDARSSGHQDNKGVWQNNSRWYNDSGWQKDSWKN